MVALVLVALPAVASAAPATPDTLPSWLRPHVGASLARAHWGVAAVDLETGEPVVEWNADRYFVPASNLKLVVAATALETLGPDYRWTTSVHATAPIGPDGALAGDLVLYGTGDPNLSGRYTDSMTSIFSTLADSLAARGLARVEGDLVADESLWDEDRVRGTWETYDLLWWYAAPVGPLGFNDNAIDFSIRPGAAVGDPPLVEGVPESSFWSLENVATTGPRGSEKTFDLTREPGTNRIVAYGVLPIDEDPDVEYFSVVDPAAYAATVFGEILSERGISIEGRVRVVSDPADSPVVAGEADTLAVWISPPLTRVVESVLGRSQNWHAEQLLKTIAAEAAGDGSWDAGLAVERRVLARLGVDTTAFALRDASGLSAGNLVTPHAVVDLLAAMRDRPHAGVWLEAFPTAAESGSLRHRFHQTAAAGRVRAKTGFIEHVYALSGYLTTDTDREIAFSVIVNGAGPGGEEATAAIDRLVVALVSESIP